MAAKDPRTHHGIAAQDLLFQVSASAAMSRQIQWGAGRTLVLLLALTAQAAVGSSDQRLEQLRTELSRSESGRDDASGQLSATESAISSTTARLRELALARAQAQTALSAAAEQSQALEQIMAEQQGQMAVLLKRHYTAGQGDSLERILGGDDPNQAARDAVYLQALSKAKAKLVQELKTSLERKARLTREKQQRAEELASIETASLAEQTRLEQQRQEHRALVSKLSDQIQKQRHEIDTLKADEQRMGRLVQGISQLSAPSTSAAKTSAANTSPPAPQPPPAGAPAPGTVRATIDQATSQPTAKLEPGAFIKLKGRLPTPLRGELVHRYGSPKAEGASWKGIFIKAGAGEVRATAVGRVVFAEWLRGFGNLIILDHGDEYLTVYGNNEALYRKVGEMVASGEVIAAVGNSGGNRETGLYFELRHQGQAVDPAKWIAPR